MKYFMVIAHTIEKNNKEQLTKMKYYSKHQVDNFGE